MIKKCLFILSPGYGMFLQSKSILRQINNNGYKIDILLPKPKSYFELENNLRSVYKEIEVDNLIFQTNPLNNLSFRKDKHKYFKKIIKERNFIKLLKIRSIIERIYNRTRIISLEKRLIFIIKFGSSILNKCSLIKKLNYDFVIFDITEEDKLYLTTWISRLYTIPRISLNHGLDIYSYYKTHKKSWTYKKDLLIFQYTGKDSYFYKKTYNIKANQLKIIGITNHKIDKKAVIKKNIKISNSIKQELGLSKNTKFITLASRPEDNINYCSPFGRKLYLKTIGKFINNSEDYHLLVKFHPKEKKENLNLLSKNLEIDISTKKFSVTNLSIIELASISYLGLTYHSSSCVDFSYFEIPMLEMTYPSNTKYALETINYDKFGRPESSFSTYNLAISVKNQEELSNYLRNIKEFYPGFKQRISLGYENCFDIKSFSKLSPLELIERKINKEIK